jgi:hypothetical protein
MTLCNINFKYSLYKKRKIGRKKGGMEERKREREKRERERERERGED